MARRIFSIVAFCICVNSYAPASAHGRATDPIETGRYWVYFGDKGVLEEQLVKAETEAWERMTPRAQQRRLRNGLTCSDFFDVPVFPGYLERVEASGARIRHVSRWLNAASVECSPDQVQVLKSMPMVASVIPFTLRGERIETNTAHARSILDDPVYGPSFHQNNMCRIPELHARGLSGDGILICMLDTGFWLEHESISGTRVIAVRDFLHNDDIVHDVPGEDSTGQHAHGTAVLSTIGGNRDSVLVGPAFGADFLLAKTEWTASEERFEEDAYVAAIEWADSAGADITSSSLGYIDWYTNADMDGHTPVTTRAVVMAASRGILCVTSAGNNRTDDWHIVGSPADADSILAVGAVDSAGTLAPFSSGGPTADGRTKPDVSAMGLGVFCASYAGVNQYWFLSGTSLSAPITAGVAALIMEAHPEWTAQDVRRAMMSTASIAMAPNNEIGWGIVDGVAAADFDLGTRTRFEPAPRFASLSVFPNPVNGKATLVFTLDSDERSMFQLLDISGRMVLSLDETYYTQGSHTLSLDLANIASGVYYARLISSRPLASAKIVVIK